jgi:HNH endonuclease
VGLFRKMGAGYVGIADGRRTRPFHVVVAELVLGKRLPTGAIVHHIDGNKQNNWPYNLLICPDQAYHKLIHQRTDALNACGNADWLKCKFCGRYDDQKNLRIYSTSRSGRKTLDRNIHHPACNADYLNRRYHARKENQQ